MDRAVGSASQASQAFYADTSNVARVPVATNASLNVAINGGKAFRAQLSNRTLIIIAPGLVTEGLNGLKFR